MSNLKDIEYYGEEVKALIGSSTYTDKLTEISTEKNDGLTLREFRTKKYGWVSKDEIETPIVSIIGLNEETISDEGTYRWVWFRYAIEGSIDGDDAEKLEKMTNRYAKAIKEVLKAKYGNNIGFVDRVSYSPVSKLKGDNVLFKSFSIEYKIRAMIVTN